MYTSTSVTCAASLLVCLVCLTTPTPAEATPLHESGAVEPVISLSQMAPDHACVFICTMCFPDLADTQKLLECSNRVCGPVVEGGCAMEKFIWLGHHCKDYPMVEAMWAPTARH